MADIVLTTLNAKYIHAAFGLRYLLANLGPLQANACIVEFDINQRPVDIVEALLARFAFRRVPLLLTTAFLLCLFALLAAWKGGAR